MFRRLLILVLLLPLAMTTGAATAPIPPDQQVRQTTEQMQALIREHHKEYKANQPAFYKVVNEVLTPRFDVRYIAQLVLGKNWRSASAEQRDRFASAFKQMLIRSYADTLLEYYDSIKAEWQPVRLSPDVNDVTVRTTLLRDNAQPLGIGFNVHLVDNEWKVYDISVEAISLVTNFRSQINAEIKKSSLNDVITRMEKGEAFTPPKSTVTSG